MEEGGEGGMEEGGGKVYGKNRTINPTEHLHPLKAESDSLLCPICVSGGRGKTWIMVRNVGLLRILYRHLTNCNNNHTLDTQTHTGCCCQPSYFNC